MKLTNATSINYLPPASKYLSGWPWASELMTPPCVLPDGRPWPRISIVTPSYNQGEFIEETIRSVLLQGYPNLEYIVMDGGSTDQSVEIIRRYADHLAHWESKKDDGQADAIARGFERSTGEILGYLNSDDIFLPGCLERVGLYFMEHPKEEWVVGDMLNIGSNGQQLYNRIGNPMCSMGAHVSFGQLLFFGSGFGQPASFWHRDVYFAVGGFDRSLQFSFDFDLYIRLAQRCSSGQIKGFLACFRIHPTSKTSTMDNIRQIESEMAKKKYGFYKKGKGYRKIAVYWYAMRNLIRCKIILNVKLFLGLLKCSR